MTRGIHRNAAARSTLPVAQTSDIAFQDRQNIGIKMEVGVKVGAEALPRVLEQCTNKPFLKKLWLILEDPTNWHAIRWDSDGKGIELLDERKLETDVLPSYFRTNKGSSFRRQLNYFDFSKASSTHYTHASFHRDNPESVLTIKRRENKGNTYKMIKRKAKREGVNKSPSKKQQGPTRAEFVPLKYTASIAPLASPPRPVLSPAAGNTTFSSIPHQEPSATPTNFSVQAPTHPLTPRSAFSDFKKGDSIDSLTDHGSLVVGGHLCGGGADSDSLPIMPEHLLQASSWQPWDDSQLNEGYDELFGDFMVELEQQEGQDQTTDRVLAELSGLISPTTIS
jgi:hypothetical protein